MSVQAVGAYDSFAEHFPVCQGFLDKLTPHAHSSIVAWKIPWREETGGLQSLVLQRVGHNWVTEPTALQCW